MYQTGGTVRRGKHQVNGVEGTGQGERKMQSGIHYLRPDRGLPHVLCSTERMLGCVLLMRFFSKY